MRKTAIAAVTTLIMLIATSAAAAPPSSVVDSQLNGGRRISVAPVVRNFDADGNADGSTIGGSLLVRRNRSLRAFAYARDLRPGGVYTFWWVVIPDGGVFPDDAFVARGGGTVVGDNGRAATWMRARKGQASIEGFLIPFQPLDFNLRTAEVHVEIAYHGQAEDAGGDLNLWLSDFWSGTACPESGGLNPAGVPGTTANAIGQPHCPVYIAAIFDGS